MTSGFRCECGCSKFHTYFKHVPKNMTRKRCLCCGKKYEHIEDKHTPIPLSTPFDKIDITKLEIALNGQMTKIE